METMKLCSPCLLCGTLIDLDETEICRIENGFDIHVKVCEDCKKAVSFARELMTKMRPEGCVVEIDSKTGIPVPPVSLT